MNTIKKAIFINLGALTMFIGALVAFFTAIAQRRPGLQVNWASNRHPNGGFRLVAHEARYQQYS
jgi:hypothetical protein